MTPPTVRRERIPEETRRRIAQRVRDLRMTRTSFSQGELAKRAGIDPATMNQIEQAKRLPDLATVLSLAEQLGVPASAILDDPPAKARVDGSEPQGVGGVDQSLIVSSIQAATTAALADLVTAIVAALTEWHATHVYRENGSLTKTATGERGVSRDDRR